MQPLAAACDWHRRKLDRDLRLLALEDQEHPDDPFTFSNLGSVFLELERIAEALPLLQRSLEFSHPSDSIVRKLYAMIAQGHRRLQQLGLAMETCRAGLSVHPDNVEGKFQEGIMLREIGDVAGAEASVLELLNMRSTAQFASVDTALQGTKARHNLAVIYRDQGRLNDAEAQWRAVLGSEPGFTAAALGLGDLYLTQGRHTDLDGLLGQLNGDPQTHVEASVLRARSHLARREFSTARTVLEDTIAAAPQAIWPRVILSHVLLQEGRNWSAAEEALRAVLRLDPQNTEARNNLGVLLRLHRST